MTADGGMNPEMHWDEARIALGRVAELFNANIGVRRRRPLTLRELRADTGAGPSGDRGLDTRRAAGCERYHHHSGGEPLLYGRQWRQDGLVLAWHGAAHRRHDAFGDDGEPSTS